MSYSNECPFCAIVMVYTDEYKTAMWPFRLHWHEILFLAYKKKVLNIAKHIYD